MFQYLQKYVCQCMDFLITVIVMAENWIYDNLDKRFTVLVNILYSVSANRNIIFRMQYKIGQNVTYFLPICEKSMLSKIPWLTRTKYLQQDITTSRFVSKHLNIRVANS